MSMVAAVRNRGLMRFKLYEDALNGAIFIDFMTRLVRDARQKVFLIVGDTRIHLASFDKNSGAVQGMAGAPGTRSRFSLFRPMRWNTPRMKPARDDPVAATSPILKSIPRRPDRMESSLPARRPLENQEFF
jgi:hypothetical protein